MTSSIVHLERTLRVTLPASVITNRSRSVIAFLTSSLIRMVMTVVETESIQTHSFRPNTFIPLAHRQLLSPASPKVNQCLTDMGARERVDFHILTGTGRGICANREKFGRGYVAWPMRIYANAWKCLFLLVGDFMPPKFRNPQVQTLTTNPSGNSQKITRFYLSVSALKFRSKLANLVSFRQHMLN